MRRVEDVGKPRRCRYDRHQRLQSNLRRSRQAQALTMQHLVKEETAARQGPHQMSIVEADFNVWYNTDVKCCLSRKNR